MYLIFDVNYNNKFIKDIGFKLRTSSQGNRIQT